MTEGPTVDRPAVGGLAAAESPIDELTTDEAIMGATLTFYTIGQRKRIRRDFDHGSGSPLFFRAGLWLPHNIRLRPKASTMDTEYSLKPTFTCLCKPDSARLARSRQPLHFQKAGKQCRSQRTSNVVVPLGPVQAFASKGTPQSAQRFGIDIERAQEALSRPRKRE
jgi:hypothetical protein